MLGTLSTLNPVFLALLAGLFTWGCTAAGAALVFFFKNLDKKMANVMLGFAAGVMIAASFWSLIAPAIEMSAHLGKLSFVPALVGFLLGGAFLRLVDRVTPHLHLGMPVTDKEGPKTHLRKTFLLVLSITIHNIPEGAAVGVAFGAVVAGQHELLIAAMVLAFGIGIQNFPEGAAVSIPLRGEGFSRTKSFWYGQMSAIVEPIFAVIGAYLVILVTPILPYALSFAAGAMIFVVIEELIPESQREGSTDLATAATMVGFSVMMMLDVALG
ncbi:MULTISPECIES: ZIP family metal transporter [Sporolactobacillus]|uniref:Dihydroorotate dehydrogenase n=2 Tax=Sporolactobacillus TaxID=2077 RepID=A0A0U1QQ43_9BACL|nr:MULTISPECIES: ZIP family metal transporter [Sporolactobacillus]KLI02736.1 dihydroorotate dehydrogenase [Sporolactobacillus inulinus CASD]QAA21423.1 zinc transporter ZupT [Sporolactobacillus terrae]QAA24395.1 zinc transporter ZupT [Sporolactobacillus terrae]UAK16221.1 ZIP family metal transporter [Sporolactobacillus terrae]BBN97685.1 ZIP family metal transporter [Sporolactobacillus terrae]